MEERCTKYNRASHVKAGILRQGVKITSYVNDNHRRVIEKDTKVFPKIRYCPICGFDYIKGEKNPRNYKTDINTKEYNYIRSTQQNKDS